MNRLWLRLSFILLLIIPFKEGFCFSSPIHCTYTLSTEQKVIQTIAFQCPTDINLNGAVIQFTANNPSGLGSAWGFSNMPSYPENLHFVVNQNRVSLALYYRIPKPIILYANEVTSFSFVSSHNPLNITDFTITPSR